MLEVSNKGRGKGVVSLRGSEILEGVRRIFVFWAGFFYRPSRIPNPTRSSAFPSLISAFGGRFAKARRRLIFALQFFLFSSKRLPRHSSFFLRSVCSGIPHLITPCKDVAKVRVRTVARKCSASLH